MNQLEHLLAPFEVAGLTMKNRVVMTAMHMGMGENGFILDGLIDFYEERAKAKPGPGLIIVGGCYVEKRGMGAPNFIGLDDDAFIPGLRRLTDTMHKYDTPVVAQLYHGGRYSLSVLTGEEPISASSVASRWTGEVPHELTEEEIAEVQAHFASAAVRSREAGFDASELICCAGYLVNQFLSPLTNKRTDRYGGDTIEERMTFMRETIATIREATGPDYPLFCRLSGSDFIEGSHTLAETTIVAAAMEECGVQLINVTGGWHETRVPQLTMNVPRGAYVYLAEGIHDAVREVPVVACNRINDPVLADRVLAEGRADLIGMARAFLADPQILEKASEGRLEDIRTCIACNQGCFDHVLMLKPITCLMNPRVNREKETELLPAVDKKTILIAGGGPAGMECARIAALRGHDVMLCDKSDRLGGQAILAALPPGREEFSEMVRYLSGQMKKNGVEVLLETQVTPEYVEEVNPDVLVIATGAVQLVPDIEGLDGPNVVMAWDVLTGAAQTGRTVAVIGGGATGIETATMLAEQGKDVTVIEMMPKLGADIGVSSRWVILQDADRAGVKRAANSQVVVVSERGVAVERDGEPSEILAETVVVAAGTRAVADLEADMAAEGVLDKFEVIRIGDCAGPRKAFEAIREGFELGLVL